MLCMMNQVVNDRQLPRCQQRMSRHLAGGGLPVLRRRGGNPRVAGGAAARRLVRPLRRHGRDAGHAGWRHASVHAATGDVGRRQLEVVVDLLELLHVVLLQADEALEVGVVAARAVQAVHDVLGLLLADEQDAEHLVDALAAEVGRLAAAPAVELDLDLARLDKLEGERDLIRD